MKKPFYIYILLFPILFTVIPTAIAICKPNSAQPSEIAAFESESLTFSPSVSIAVLDTTANTVSNANLEEYLIGVLAAEMPASYEMEALKAQAVAARSYIMYKASSPSEEHPDADVCNNPDHCKAWLAQEEFMKKWSVNDREFYLGKLKNAVNATKGEYMIYNGEAVEAFFFAGSGGRTEASKDVWGGDRPYLQSVESEGDIYSPDYKSEKTVSIAEFWNTLTGFNAQTIPNAGIPVIGSISRTEGGSVNEISLGGQIFTGTEIRSLFGLKSANFTLSASNSGVTFSVLGYGHGVGMSQFGANYMAKNGKKYTEILSHYYTNIQIIKN